MSNPFEGSVRSPADGDIPKGGLGGGGVRKAIEFTNRKVARELTPAEKQIARDAQERIVARWKEDEIQWIYNEGRIRHTQADRDELKGQKKKKEGRHVSEQVAERFNGQTPDKIAEGMVLEALDSQGKTRPYAFQRGKKTEREGYNLLKDQGTCYFPTELDDLSQGADAILLLSDGDEASVKGSENKINASAISLDITTNIDAIADKRSLDLSRMDPTKIDPAKIFWYDSRIKVRSDNSSVPHTVYGNGERFLTPVEYQADSKKYLEINHRKEPSYGRIETIGLSIYVPSDLVEDFGSIYSNFDKAHEAMERLCPYILHQMKVQLSETALRVLGLIRFRPGTRELDLVRIPSLGEILSQLKSLAESEYGKQQPIIAHLRRVLKVVSEEEEALIKRKNMRMRQMDSDLEFQNSIIGFNGFESSELVQG